MFFPQAMTAPGYRANHGQPMALCMASPHSARFVRYIYSLYNDLG
jgi:hypothetical protein